MKSLFGYPVKLTVEVDGRQVDVTTSLAINTEHMYVDSDSFLQVIDMIQVMDEAQKAVRDDINKRDRAKAPFRGCPLCGKQIDDALCWRPGCPSRLLTSG